MRDPDAAARKALQVIPGIGPSLARDLMRLGFRRVEELKDQDPEAMYQRLMDLEGRHVDRCVLYVFRCAVHFAQGPDPDPAMNQWWNFKDRK